MVSVPTITKPGWDKMKDQMDIESNVSVASIKQFGVIVFTHAGPQYSCLTIDAVISITPRTTWKSV